MSTLGILKERVASELRRDDLSSATEFRVVSQVSDIHDAIHTAISEYQHEKLYFMQDRATVTFNTVAAQDRYTSADAAGIARITKIDYAYAVISGMSVKLWPRRADLMEGSNLGDGSLSGQPAFYSWFAESIVLEPIPNDAFAMRFGCWLKITAPAADDTTGNRWMTDGELLIRSRAKAELYAHVIKDTQKASGFYELAAGALKTLHDITQDMTQPEAILVEVWDPYG